MDLKAFGQAAVIIAGLGLSAPVEAAPLPPAPRDSLGAGQIDLVDFRCGPGRHLTRFGRCRPNFRGFYGPGLGFGFGHRRHYGGYGDYGRRHGGEFRGGRGDGGFGHGRGDGGFGRGGGRGHGGMGMGGGRGGMGHGGGMGGGRGGMGGGRGGAGGHGGGHGGGGGGRV